MDVHDLFSEHSSSTKSFILKRNITTSSKFYSVWVTRNYCISQIKNSLSSRDRILNQQIKYNCCFVIRVLNIVSSRGKETQESQCCILIFIPSRSAHFYYHYHFCNNNNLYSYYYPFCKQFSQYSAKTADF